MSDKQEIEKTIKDLEHAFWKLKNLEWEKMNEILEDALEYLILILTLEDNELDRETTIAIMKIKRAPRDRDNLPYLWHKFQNLISTLQERLTQC